MLTIWLAAGAAAARAAAGGEDGTARDDAGGLIANGSLEQPAAGGKAPLGFELTGQAVYGNLGDKSERAGKGIRLQSAAGRGEKCAALVSTRVTGLSPGSGRWFRLRVIGLVQDGFAVDKDELFLGVEFFRDGGSNSLDQVKKRFYPQVVAERRALDDPGTNRQRGEATWRPYDLEFRTPFPEVDGLRPFVGFEHGSGHGPRSEFWIAEISLVPVGVPADYVPPSDGRKIALGREAQSQLLPLGGRWYYDPRARAAALLPSSITPMPIGCSTWPSGSRPRSPTTPRPGCGPAISIAGEPGQAGRLRRRQRHDFVHSHAAGAARQGVAQPSNGDVSRPLSGVGRQPELHPGAG